MMMSYFKNELPQQGRSKAPESLPGQKICRLTNSLGRNGIDSRVRTDRNMDDRARLAGTRIGIAAQGAAEDQVFTSAYGPRGAETRQEAKTIIDPFCKRPSLARTAPLKRSTSLPQEVAPATGDKSRGEEKRKRSEDSPPETAKKLREAKAVPRDTGTKDSREKLLRKVSGLIGKLDEKVENLHSITSGSRNTKVETKELAEELSILMKALSGVDIRGLGVS